MKTGNNALQLIREQLAIYRKLLPAIGEFIKNTTANHNQNNPNIPPEENPTIQTLLCALEDCEQKIKEYEELEKKQLLLEAAAQEEIEAEEDDLAALAILAIASRFNKK